jgi:hypothetical protein
VINNDIGDGLMDDGLMEGIYDLVKIDVCYILCLLLSTILGELKPEVATPMHLETIRKAVQSVLPGLWTELARLGDDLIGIGEHESTKDTPLFNQNLLRLNTILILFQCLGPLSEGSSSSDSSKKAASEAVVRIAFKFSAFSQPFVPPGMFPPMPNEEPHEREVGVCKWIFDQKIPLIEDTKEWFAMLATQAGNLSETTERESTSRAMTLHGVSDPMSPNNISEEERLKMVNKIHEDQKRRGLLNADKKSAVKEPASSVVVPNGTKCEHCGTEGVSGSNIKLMRCSGCYKAWYCSPDCQKSNWPKHKAACRKKQAKNKK